MNEKATSKEDRTIDLDQALAEEGYSAPALVFALARALGIRVSYDIGDGTMTIAGADRPRFFDALHESRLTFEPKGKKTGA